MIVYEDRVVRAELVEDGAVLGQILVTPKADASTLAELPEDIAVQLFYVASYAATAVFEGLGAAGTNILVHEGDQLRVEVIARSSDDGLDLMWEPKRAEPAELEAVAKQVKSELFYVGQDAIDKKQQPDPADAPPEEVDQSVPPEDNYKLKQLDRAP